MRTIGDVAKDGDQLTQLAARIALTQDDDGRQDAIVELLTIARHSPGTYAALAARRARAALIRQRPRPEGTQDVEAYDRSRKHLGDGDEAWTGEPGVDRDGTTDEMRMSDAQATGSCGCNSISLAQQLNALPPRLTRSLAPLERLAAAARAAGGGDADVAAEAGVTEAEARAAWARARRVLRGGLGRG